MSQVLADYQANGFAVVPDCLGDPVRQAAIRAVEDIQARVGDLPAGLSRHLVMERDLPDGKRGGVSAAEAGDAIFIIGDLAAFDRRLVAPLVEDRVVALVRSALGVDDVRLHLCNMTGKAPRVGSGIGWHQDFPNKYICPGSPSFVRVLLCLDPMDGDNGATRFLAGSHRGKGGDEVTVSCGAGDAVLVHPLVRHGGTPNHSDRHRRVLVAQWGRPDDPPLPGQPRESLTGLGDADIRAWLRSPERQEPEY